MTTLVLRSLNSGQRPTLAAFVLTALLAACGGGGGEDSTDVSVESTVPAVPVPQPVEVLRNDFEQTACMDWETYRSGDATHTVFDVQPLAIRSDASSAGFAVSQGPWWIDGNHAPPGAGYLNLIAISYYQGWLGAKGEVVPTEPGKALDLRGAKLTLRWRAPSLVLPEASKLVLWFQTRAFEPLSGQRLFVNYALTGQPLKPVKDNTGWIETELTLEAQPDDWTCLGANAARNNAYGCARSIDEPLSNFETDLGFIILSPDADTAFKPDGAVEFDRISMTIPPGNIATHEGSPSYLLTETNACRPTPSIVFAGVPHPPVLQRP